MKLIINNHHIKESIENILYKVKKETKYLDDIFVKQNQILCTCPYHSEGHEKKPACYIYTDIDKDFEYGTFHCFACGESGSLAKLIGKCYNKNTEFGKQWLVNNYGDTLIEEIEYLPKIEITKSKKECLSESILDSFDYDNEKALDYLINKRHLEKNIIEKFKIGFDKESNCVTFPCWDVHNNLLGVFKRSIYGKFFNIPKIYPKPIYLLNEAIKNNCSKIYVCESQINALTLYGWGFPAIALFGTGSSEQYNILNKSGIRQYVLCFDGDLAGEIGVNKFLNNIKNSLISQIILPKGKDVNDLTKEEFINLEIKNI